MSTETEDLIAELEREAVVSEDSARDHDIRKNLDKAEFCRARAAKKRAQSAALSSSLQEVEAARSELTSQLAAMNELAESRKRERDAARQEVERLRAERESWRNLHLCDDKPSMYRGLKQPGAHPHHYGPDSVVVDGDWLAVNDPDTLRAERDAAVATTRELVEAWTTPGPHADAHRDAQKSLHWRWPTLAEAVERLVATHPDVPEGEKPNG